MSLARSHGVPGVLVCLLLVVTLSGSSALAKQFHVRPNGTASGIGSSSRPWDLQTALNHPSTVAPGDTIWLHGGTYRGSFSSLLVGTASAPIIVRSYPGEWAVIDNGGSTSSGLWIKGAYVWFWSFEVMSSNPTPTRDEAGVDFYTSRGSRLINVVIHDEGASGITPFSPSIDAEVVGCLAFYNGRADDPSHRNGYGLYSQNNQPSKKTFTDNFFFNNFGIFQIHIAGSSTANLDDMSFVGNTVFGHSLYDNKNVIALFGNFESGSGKNMNPVWSSNFFYHADLWLGYNGDGVERATLTDNYFFSGSLKEHAANTYAARSGNVFTTSGNQVFVQPNTYADRYDRRRANIIVFNASGASTATIPLPAGVLSIGDTFQIRDVQNYFGAPVDSGIYAGGSISFRMPGSTAPITAPRSVPSERPGTSLPVHTNNDFGVFILTSTTAGSAIPEVSGSLSISPSNLPAGGGTVTLSWTSQNASSASVDQGIGPVAITGSRTLQVTETKTFTLTLNGPGGPITSQATVQVAGFVLPAVALLSPANGRTNLLTEVDFTWSPVAGATAYEIQIARDSSFRTLVYSNASLDGTALRLPGLDLGATYHWRVRAANAAGTGSYSPRWTFSITTNRIENGFPLDLQGTPPESKTMAWTTTKPDDADSAHVRLWVFDADGTAEGVLCVNETDSLILFGRQASSTFDHIVTSFTMTMAARAWTNGVNTLRVSHTATSGFRIDSLLVTFSRSSVPVIAPVRALQPNFPNPFNPDTRISFTVSERGSSQVQLVVYDLLGRQIAVLVDGPLSPGAHTVIFHARGLSAGTYFCRLTASGETPEIEKMLLLR